MLSHVKTSLSMTQTLSNQSSANSLNIWEPIYISLEGFGTITLLKVIYIGTKMKVNSSYTDKIIKEKR